MHIFDDVIDRKRCWYEPRIHVGSIHSCCQVDVPLCLYHRSRLSQEGDHMMLHKGTKKRGRIQVTMVKGATLCNDLHDRSRSHSSLR